MDRNKFTETLRMVMELSDASEKPLEKDEVLEYFKDMTLTDNQRTLVLQYINHHEYDLVKGEARQGAKDILEAEEQENARNQLQDNAIFQMYRRELDEIVLCTDEEEQFLYGELVGGDETVVPKLSRQWLHRIVELAKQYAHDAQQFQDLIQEGNLSILLTLEELLGTGQELDYIRAIEAKVKESMEAFLLKEDKKAELTETILAKSALLHEAQKILEQKLGRMPTEMELSRYTNIPVIELKEILSLEKQKGSK